MISEERLLKLIDRRELYLHELVHHSNKSILLNFLNVSLNTDAWPCNLIERIFLYTNL